MSKVRRVGFNANAAELGDVSVYHAALEAWQPDFTMMMNTLGPGGGTDRNNVVVRTYEHVQKWGGKIIYRPYEVSEGHLWRVRTPKQQVDWLKSFKADWAWFNVGNEPRPNEKETREKASPWYAEFVYRAVEAGLRVIIPGGFATGNYEKHEVFGGWWDLMLKAIADVRDRRIDGYNQVALGAHSYGHAVPPLHTDGRNIYDMLDPERVKEVYWPKREDIFYDGDTGDNHLMFRETWLIEQMCRLLNRPVDYELVDVHITECDSDRLPHLVSGHADLVRQIDSLAGQEVRGAVTLRRYYERMFPGQTPEYTYASMLYWFEREALPNWRSYNIFTWSYHKEWVNGYGIQRWPEFIEYYPVHWEAMQVIDKPIPPAQWVTALASTRDNSAIRVRSTPAISSSNVIGSLKGPNNFLRYDPNLVGGRWYHIHYGAVDGFVDKEWVMFTPYNEPCPEPEPCPDCPEPEPCPECPPIVYVPDWREIITDERAQKTVQNAIDYSKDPFGDIGHNLKVALGAIAGELDRLKNG